MIRAKQGFHSQKPYEFYDSIETMVPKGTYLELFGRDLNSRSGWVTVGDQIDMGMIPYLSKARQEELKQEESFDDEEEDEEDEDSENEEQQNEHAVNEHQKDLQAKPKCKLTSRPDMRKPERCSTKKSEALELRYKNKNKNKNKKKKLRDHKRQAKNEKKRKSNNGEFDSQCDEEDEEEEEEDNDDDGSVFELEACEEKPSKVIKKN